MDRSAFIIATAVALFAAFLLGWFASWLVHRLTRPTAADLGELDRMARQLHDAGIARDRALRDLEGLRAEHATRLAAAEAEAAAAAEGLRESSLEIEELRHYIETRLSRNRPV